MSGHPQTLKNFERKSWKTVFLGSQDSAFQLRFRFVDSTNGFRKVAANLKIADGLSRSSKLPEKRQLRLTAPFERP
jgi:hypothetical protein